MEEEDIVREKVRMYGITEGIYYSLKRYTDDGIKTGGFLRAVLEDRLFASLARADENNKVRLPSIALYVYNELPMDCWGSVEKVKKWKGLNRRDVEE